MTISGTHSTIDNGWFRVSRQYWIRNFCICILIKEFLKGLFNRGLFFKIRNSCKPIDFVNLSRLILFETPPSAIISLFEYFDIKLNLLSPK